ncbi:hypothetical protein BT93_C1890 [Corymbia citriodora subsp. variegata]|nr:hypothetical protein BT93_C1890 [Corymbia citriodora subsp. variegata]
MMESAEFGVHDVVNRAHGSKSNPQQCVLLNLTHLDPICSSKSSPHLSTVHPSTSPIYTYRLTNLSPHITTPLLTPLTLLVLSLVLSFSPKPSNASSSTVLDTVGHKLQTGQEVSNGLPVKFSPADAGNSTIRLSTDLNIWFNAATICVQSTVWRLGAYDGTVKQYFIETGGVLGNPGPETISNWFKIEKLDEDYKLVFCPTVCDTCKVICRDVGIYVDGGTRRLALSDEPFRVMFKKA